jgi:hypothetical protein
MALTGGRDRDRLLRQQRGTSPDTERKLRVVIEEETTRIIEDEETVHPAFFRKPVPNGLVALENGSRMGSSCLLSNANPIVGMRAGDSGLFLP